MKKNSHITVTDQFCGAGGSSQGIRTLSRKMGGGLEVKLALNHWALAIQTHNTNFPNTDHDCTDISACDPRRYPSTDILITSPECTNHSLAKGKKRKYQQQIEMFGRAIIDPNEERSRATMWDVPRFAEYHNYNFVIVENVVDARYWSMFDAWLKAMHCLNYNHECVFLNSQHAHPTPQSRDRMYVVFWKKGNKKPDLSLRPRGYCSHCAKETDTWQSWKRSDKNWGKFKQQYVYRCPTCNTIVEPYYHAAFNCIDWSIPGTRIGDRKKPLSENTMRRIKYGIDKYWNQPQIISTRYTSGVECRVKGAIESPLPTQPGDQSHAILNPIIVKRNHNTTLSSLVRDSVNDPLPTQLTDNGFHILTPILLNNEHDSSKNKKVRNALKESAYTQTTRATSAVVMPFIIELNRTGKAREAEKALSTILAGGNHHGVVTPFIVENHGQSKSRKVSDRLACITTKDKHGIITTESFRAFLTQYYGGSDQASNITEPARSFRTKDHTALVNANTQLPIPKIEDCYYRMLLPHEVQSGMGFDSDYIVLGNSKEKVKQLGNANPPPTIELLAQRCIETLM